MINIRNYNPDADYQAVADLYKDTSTYGGVFDEARDSEAQLAKISKAKPDAILVAEVDGEIVGTISFFEDGRFAYVCRFAVRDNKEVEVELWKKAKEIFKQKGHKQILVYAPVSDIGFEQRYTTLGFNKGNDYTCYWQDI